MNNIRKILDRYEKAFGEIESIRNKALLIVDKALKPTISNEYRIKLLKELKELL